MEGALGFGCRLENPYVICTSRAVSDKIQDNRMILGDETMINSVEKKKKSLGDVTTRMVDVFEVCEQKKAPREIEIRIRSSCRERITCVTRIGPDSILSERVIVELTLRA